jgi:hypothetical protein
MSPFAQDNALTQRAEFSAEMARRAESRRTAPVFVLGCPRSGTTLLYHMLLSAGDFVVYRAESHVFSVLEPRFGDLGREANRLKLLDEWQKTELFQRTGLERDEVRDEVRRNCRNGGDFLRIVMEAMARRQGVKRWADCTPEHLLYLKEIKRAIPQAIIVHIIRDGRDVALSLEKQAWIRPLPWDHRNTLEAAAMYWQWLVLKGREQGRNLGPDYKEVRYEDLVGSPGEVLKELGDFIEQDLDYDKIERVAIGSVSEPNSSFAHEMKAGASPVGRWKTALTARQQERVDALLGETLRELGYSPDDRGAPARADSLVWKRSLYRSYFDAKLALKKQGLFRMFVSSEMPGL